MCEEHDQIHRYLFISRVREVFDAYAYMLPLLHRKIEQYRKI